MRFVLLAGCTHSISRRAAIVKLKGKCGTFCVILLYGRAVASALARAWYYTSFFVRSWVLEIFSRRYSTTSAWPVVVFGPPSPKTFRVQ